jgi:hypothetical protein
MDWSRSSISDAARECLSVAAQRFEQSLNGAWFQRFNQMVVKARILRAASIFFLTPARLRHKQ